MALISGEYGPVDTVTGRPVSTSESGAFYTDTGEPYSPTSAATAAPAPEYSAGGDYYRIPNGGVFGGKAAQQFYGGAGQAHQYDFYKKQPDGAWALTNPGEHNEEATYFWAGVNTPQYVEALQKPETARTALDQARLAVPGAIGQAVTRSEASLTGGSNEDDARQELAFYSNKPEIVASLSDKYTPDMWQQVRQQLMDSTPTAQSARAEEDGGFGDLLPMIALVGIGIATGGFGMFGTGAGMGTGAASSLAAADAMAGIGALEYGVGSGIMGSIGTNAAIGAGKSLVTGGDPLEGAVMGGLGGAITGSGMLGNVSGGLIDATGATGYAANAITKGVNAAATGAIGSLANGGSFSDMLEGGVISGLTSGASNYVAGAVLPGTNNTIAGGAGGVAGGFTQALLSGGDVGTGIMRGGLAGAAGGLATDMGAGPSTAGAVGALTGGLINSAVQQDPVTGQAGAPSSAAPTPTPTEQRNNGLLFSRVGPQFINNPRTSTRWGTRLSGA